MLVHGELISEFVRQSFLDPDDDRIVDKILEAVVPGVGVTFGSFMTREQAREMLRKAHEKMLGGGPQPIPVPPQRKRQAARKRVADRTGSVAARVLKDVGLSVIGYEVGRLLTAAKGAQNLAAVTRLLNRRVNERLGIANDQRGEVPRADMERVMEDLDAIGDEAAEQIKKAMTNAKS